MAKGMFIGVSGAARKTTNAYIGVSGVARKVKQGYIGVSGVARRFLGGGPVITFKVMFLINMFEYQAEEGMTWSEFIASDYNDGSFEASGNYVYWTSPYGGSLTLKSSDGVYEKLSDTILAYDESDINSAYGSY